MARKALARRSRSSAAEAMACFKKIPPAQFAFWAYTSEMSSEKEPFMSLIKSRELPIKPPPRGIDLPCDDGEPMETARHRQQMNLLITALTDAWSDRRDFFVGGNMFVYYSELQAKRNDFRGPDFFVVLDTDWNQDRRGKKTVVFLTW